MIITNKQVIHLVITRPPNFKYKPGDYIFVNIPAIAKYEWHPFTISSSPEQPGEIWLHIRVVGTWTTKLYKMYEEKDKSRGSKFKELSLLHGPINGITDFMRFLLVYIEVCWLVCNWYSCFFLSETLRYFTRLSTHRRSVMNKDSRYRSHQYENNGSMKVNASAKRNDIVENRTVQKQEYKEVIICSSPYSINTIITFINTILLQCNFIQWCSTCKRNQKVICTSCTKLFC